MWLVKRQLGALATWCGSRRALRTHKRGCLACRSRNAVPKTKPGGLGGMNKHRQRPTKAKSSRQGLSSPFTLTAHLTPCARAESEGRTPDSHRLGRRAFGQPITVRTCHICCRIWNQALRIGPSAPRHCHVLARTCVGHFRSVHDTVPFVALPCSPPPVGGRTPHPRRHAHRKAARRRTTRNRNRFLGVNRTTPRSAGTAA